MRAVMSRREFLAKPVHSLTELDNLVVCSRVMEPACQPSGWRDRCLTPAAGVAEHSLISRCMSCRIMIHTSDLPGKTIWFP